MITTFLATLTPMITLFICIAVGFVLGVTKILPKNSGKVLALLENWVFCPALSFSTMAQFFNIETLGVHLTNILLATAVAILSIILATLIAKLIVREDSYERGIYKYALAFGNSGYLGDPIVLSLFGDLGLSFYKILCIPISITIYTWGLKVLTPKEKIVKGQRFALFKKLFNAPMVALFIGMIVGITGLGNYIYSAPSLSFFVGALNSLKACMGPVAMLICGLTIANYSIPTLIKNKKVYVCGLFRLIILPIVIVAAIFGLKELVNVIFGLSINNNFFFLIFFALGTAVGLNTVIFPEAFGGDPSIGASMAMITHTLCVITTPLMFALLAFLLGPVPIF